MATGDGRGRTQDAGWRWRKNERANGRTKDKGDGTALPRTEGDQGVVDAAEE